MEWIGEITGDAVHAHRRQGGRRLFAVARLEWRLAEVHYHGAELRWLA